MQLGLMLGYSGTKMELPIALVQEAEKLGYTAVWTSESYGSDAITPLTWLGALTSKIQLGTAIMQMPARTPAMTAMTAMTLDALSGGRCLLGVGLSGPQVVEGWHGQPYGKPLEKTREYVSILRAIFKRAEPLTYDGVAYHIPYQGVDATGLGKPLKSILHGRPDLPIYLAAIGPKNITLTAEIADGWLPIFFSPERYAETQGAAVAAGLAKAGKSAAQFAIEPTVQIAVGDDLEMCYNQLRPMLALYIGGMGARGKNFYFDLVCLYGFEEAAHKIQDLYLAGNKGEALMAVPEALIDAVALVGPRDRIKDRLAMWKDSPITRLNLGTHDPDAIRMVAELVL
jgi:F420-dependent oxidoreductase-like protein